MGSLHALQINAVELLRQPGAERRLDLDLAASELGVDDERITGDVHVGVHAVSNVDGIVISGTVDTPWKSVCRRCLVVVTGVAGAKVEEIYQYELTDPDAYEISGDRIDLAPAVREYVLLELPDGPLCRTNCEGICSVCGTDRNQDSCGCDTSVTDDRWAALDDFDFGD